MIYLNGVAVSPTLFPDKTSQVWHLPQELLEAVYKANECVVAWAFESEAELVHVAQLKDLLDTYCDRAVLSIPYLPYGRQDKRVSNDSTFALRTFAKLVNAMGWHEVRTVDAHCDERARLIEHLENETPRDAILAAFEATKADTVLFPDTGAVGRYGCYFEKTHTAVGSKIRDQSTGDITGYEISGDLKYRIVLIIDDLCDGGKTFTEASHAAIKKGAHEVHLYVSHGIFSKGLNVLRDAGIKRIFTKEGEQP